MQEPKVGVIVPVYNVEKYLPECLDSLLNQDYRNFVILAINDGSTDASPQILESYEQNHPANLFVFHKANGGVSSARNLALTQLKNLACEYVCFADSDDKVSNNFISDFIENFRLHQVDYGVCGVSIFGCAGHQRKDSFSEPYRLNNHGEVISHFFGIQRWTKRDQTNFRFLSNRCFAYHYIANLSFNECLITSEDQEFFFDASEKIEQGIVIPNSNYFYRLRQSSLSHNHLKDLDELNFYLDQLKSKVYRTDLQTCIYENAVNCWWLAINKPTIQQNSTHWDFLDACYQFLKNYNAVKSKKTLKRLYLYRLLKPLFKLSILKKKTRSSISSETFYE